MSKTREALGAELQATMFQSLDDEAFERLEETLIYADVGAPTTARIVERLEGEADGGELTGGEDLTRGSASCWPSTARLDGDTIDASEQPDGDPDGGRQRHRQDHHDRQDRLAPPEGARPVGAAGRGRHLPRRGGRAARRMWAERAGCEIVRGEPGSDPGAVVFDALEAAAARGHDVVIVTPRAGCTPSRT